VKIVRKSLEQSVESLLGGICRLLAPAPAERPIFRRSFRLELRSVAWDMALFSCSGHWTKHVHTHKSRMFTYGSRQVFPVFNEKTLEGVNLLVGSELLARSGG